MSDLKRPLAPDADAPLDAPDALPARRRLLRGGLAAGPVLMTLVSRPVLGGGGPVGGLCTTPSAFCSANASTAGRGVACEGRTHGYWKNCDASKWPSPYKPTTSFNSAFNTPQGPYNGKSLLDVLNLGGGSPNNVARDCVAALLNVQSGWVHVLTVPAIKDIWSEFITKGYYSPSAGVHWYADDIITYLSSTMPV